MIAVSCLENPMTKNKPLKKLSTTPPDTKAQTHFVEKGNVYPRLLKSDAVPTTRGQRYTETNDC